MHPRPLPDGTSAARPWRQPSRPVARPSTSPARERRRSAQDALEPSDGHRGRLELRPYTPPRHEPYEWYTRRAALALGIACLGSGTIVLANASIVQTPFGAAMLYLYQSQRGPHTILNEPMGTLHDWAVAEGMALCAQGAALGLIATGFGLAIYAVH